MKSKKFSFFYPVADLDITFKLRKEDRDLTTTERKIPKSFTDEASENHAALRKACKDTQKKLNQEDSDLKGNLAASRFSIFYTETFPEEGSFGDDIYKFSFDIGTPPKSGKTCSPGDFYSERTQQNDQAGSKFVRYTKLVTDISNRINLFERVYATTDNKLFDNIKSITRIADFNAALEKGDFTDAYHHTEQVILEVSSNSKTYSNLKKILPHENIYIFGGCHDLHSNLCVCPQCAVGIVASHHSHDSGLIYSLKKAINEKNPRNEFYDDFFWTTRVSCSKSSRNTGDLFTQIEQSTTSTITYDLTKSERPFLQSLYSKLDIDDASPVESEYTGAIFSSRVIHKKRVPK